MPIAQSAAGNDRVQAGSLPAGRYASLIHTGPYDQLVQANRALLEWIASAGLTMDRTPTPRGDAFGCRYEAYLSDPDEKPERTEVAIRLAG